MIAQTWMEKWLKLGQNDGLSRIRLDTIEEHC